MHHKQKGATIWVTLIWIIMGVAVAVVSVKLIPIYLDNFTIAGALEGMEREQGLPEMKNKEILSRLNKHLLINNVRSLDKENIKIVRKKGKVIAIDIDYEARENLFYNVDAVVSFKNHLDVK